MNVVFDLGGVLLRWQPHEFMARLLPQHAADAEAARALVASFFQSFDGDWGEFDRGTLQAGPLAERIAARTGLALADVVKVIEAVPFELQPIAETVTLVERLQARGHALYFLSNMPLPYAEHLEASHAFLALFRDGVFSARVRMSKPDAVIYAHAASTFGIDGGNTLFIDDVLHNVEAAQAAGWQALHFRSPAQCERDLVAMGLLGAGPSHPVLDSRSG